MWMLEYKYLVHTQFIVFNYQTEINEYVWLYH